MLKISRTLISLVVLITIVISIKLSVSAKPSLLLDQGIALEKSEPSLKQKLPSPKGSRLMGELEELEELKLSFKRKLPPPRGSRGGLLCPVSPGILEREFVIWSDRPLFLWQADTRQTKLQKLEVLQDGTLNYKAEILWEKSLSAASQSVKYDGQALQPGQNYQWQLTWNQQNQNQQWRPYKLDRQFRVMAALQRNQIAADLQTLAAQLRANKASDEAIAIRQANYFVDRGLLSDAFQVLYTIKNPSVEMTKAMQDLMNSVCKSSEKALSNSSSK